MNRLMLSCLCAFLSALPAWVARGDDRPALAVNSATARLKG